MSDITLSLIVIVCTGMLIALIFITVGKNKKKKEQILSSYCDSRGYTFNAKKDALEKEIRIEGDTFVLTSSMTSSRQDENTGSSSWDKKTFWVLKGKRIDCSAFVIGTVSTTLSWDKMPEWMKDAVTQKAIIEFGAGANAHPKAVPVNEKMSLMIFETDEGIDREILDKVVTSLKSWPVFASLVMRCTTSDISIQLNDFYIRNVSELEKVLSLGSSLIS